MSEREELVGTDLAQRCKELLDWGKTGLLAGGDGGAVRALASRLEPTVGPHYALSAAESQTKDDAMREVVRVASVGKDATCYIERSKVRAILIGQPDENLHITEIILSEVDALPIFTAERATP